MDLSTPVSNILSTNAAQPAFGKAGAPTSASPEKVTTALKSAVSPIGAKTESAAAPIDESQMLDAYYGSFGDDKTRDLLRKKQQGPLLEMVIGTDDRQQVSNVNEYPWRCVASLRITASDGTGWIGTGWLVNRRVLLTAGHCVYMADHGGWVQQIEVIPGRAGDTFTYGSSISTAFRSVNGWITNSDRNYDYGAILLPEDSPFGDQVGWFGYQVRNDDDLKTLTVNLSGYPGDKPMGTQWFLSGGIKEVGSTIFDYDIDTAGGQSGAPVWITLDDGIRYGVGVHTNGSLNGNSATRITQEVFDNVTAWIKEAP
jgi:glutamyl endopeptidase